MATTDSRGCGEIEQKPRTDGKATPRVCVCVLFAVSCWWRPPRATMRGRPGACQMLTPCQLGSLPTPTCTRMNSLVLCDGDVYKKMLDSEGKTERRCPRCQIRSFTFLSLSPPLFLSLAHTYTHPSTHARSLQLTLGSTEGKEKRRPPFESQTFSGDPNLSDRTNASPPAGKPVRSFPYRTVPDRTI